MQLSQLKTLSLVLITSFLLSGCDSESLIPKDKVAFESEQLVTVESKPDAKIYHWKQLSGPKVSIPNKKLSTLEFTAPKVDKDTLLTFELKAVFDWKIRDIMLRDTVEVKVSPILIINGHRLPPEPNPEENNATLLGIDSNNNGVRDDVERAIYLEYPTKLAQKFLMQAAKADQSMLADPKGVINAIKWQKMMSNQMIACKLHIRRSYKIILGRDVFKFLEAHTYNTKDRVEKYLRYNHALSGGVYGVEDEEINQEACEFDVAEAVAFEAQK